MSRFIYFGLLAIATLIVPFAGCGSGVKLVPVSGTVTVAGEPVEGITVTFLPKNQIEGEHMVPYGQTDAEGKFTVQVSPSQMGAPAGEYTVLFQKLRMPDGSMIPEDQSAADVGAVNQIPDMYMNPGPASETVTIPEGGSQNLTFDLKAKR